MACHGVVSFVCLWIRTIVRSTYAPLYDSMEQSVMSPPYFWICVAVLITTMTCLFLLLLMFVPFSGIHIELNDHCPLRFLKYKIRRRRIRWSFTEV